MLSLISMSSSYTDSEERQRAGHHGQGPRQARPRAEGGAATKATALIVEGVNMIKRHTKPNPGKNIKGGIVEREASLHASNVQLRLPRVRRADAHRPQDARRRPQGPHLPQVRGSRRQMNRLKEKYQKDVVPALTKEFGYKNVMAVPKIEKVVVNMGLGEATVERQDHRHRRRRARAHHRPEAGDAPREEVDRAVQGPQGPADRRRW